MSFLSSFFLATEIKKKKEAKRVDKYRREMIDKKNDEKKSDYKVMNKKERKKI